MWIYFLAFLVIVSVPFLPLILSEARRRRILKNVPGPEENFIIGHAKHFVNQPPTKVYKILKEFSAKYGKVWKAHLLHETSVFVSDTKILEVILSSRSFISKSVEYKLLSNWLGDGLLLSKGKKWHARRKIITPAFHFKILEEFMEVFNRNSDLMIEELKKFKPKEAVDVNRLVTLSTLDIICETSMGASVHALKNQDSDYVQAVKKIGNIIHLRMFDTFLRIPLTFFFSKEAQVERNSLKILHDFTDSVIVSRRKQLIEEQESGKSLSSDDMGIKKKNALLDILLQSTIDGKPLTNSDIREEVDTFMFEGHDTTTSTISFALYRLALHPEIQEKVVIEIFDVIGEEEDSPVTNAKLNELTYFDAVIKEVLRIHPTVPFFMRGMEEDFVAGDITIPKGATIYVACYDLNRDPEVFPEPEKFLPERFLSDKEVFMKNPYCFLPFSAGPRNCIGQKFALLEIKCMMTKILRNFKLTVDPSYKEPIPVAELVLKSENGVVLNLERRK